MRKCTSEPIRLRSFTRAAAGVWRAGSGEGGSAGVPAPLGLGVEIGSGRRAQANRHGLGGEGGPGEGRGMAAHARLLANRLARPETVFARLWRWRPLLPERWKWGTEKVGTLFLEQVGDILIFHFRQPPHGRLTRRLASFDENGMFGWGLSISITFADQPDPNHPMYGYGWGTLPIYSEVNLSILGYFTENGIVFIDNYTFDNNFHVQCEHYWALEAVS